MKSAGDPFSAARLLTTETKRPITGGHLWGRDGKYIGYVKDNDGDENFNVYLMGTSASTPAGSPAPPSQDLTGLKGVRVQLYSAPRADPDVVYIGVNDRDKTWHDLYKLRLAGDAFRIFADECLLPDGLEVPAYLTLPKGVPAQGMPTLVISHGARGHAIHGATILWPSSSPTAATRCSCPISADPRAAARSSSMPVTANRVGLCRTTLPGREAPDRPGRGRPETHRHSRGDLRRIRDARRRCIHADLYRTAVDIVEPSNLVTLLETIQPYWQAGRKIMYVRMADLGTPERKAWLKDRSPLHAAEKIRTPLLVVQGANDPRVNRGEAEQIVIAVRDRRFSVEYTLAPDEGHGFARPVNRMAMFMASEKFLAKHLDGHYQEGVRRKW